MKVGDLVMMSFDDWTHESIALHGDEWGVGIVLETDNRHDYCHVHWSEIGPSWETQDHLEKVSGSR